MVFNFSVLDRLIFQNPDISNFCKSFVFLKAITDSDDFFVRKSKRLSLSFLRTVSILTFITFILARSILLRRIAFLLLFRCVERLIYVQRCSCSIMASLAILS